MENINKKQLNTLVDILIKDRDGNGKLSINDIILINKDMLSIFYLTTILVCIATDTNNISDILLYIFLELIPEKTGIKIINTPEDSENITEIINLINVFLTKSITIQKIKNMIENTCCKFITDIKKNIIISKNNKYLTNQINFLK